MTRRSGGGRPGSWSVLESITFSSGEIDERNASDSGLDICSDQGEVGEWRRCTGRGEEETAEPSIAVLSRVRVSPLESSKKGARVTVSWIRSFDLFHF